MEPSDSVDVEGKERKKIHFADPSSAPTQLDPRQVEMVSETRRDLTEGSDPVQNDEGIASHVTVFLARI